MKVRVVTLDEARDIIRNRMPLGNFICFFGGVKAIANESGDAEVKKFDNPQEACRWLAK